MVCRRPAAQGGESLILDGWSLLSRIEQDDPDLFRDLIERARLHKWTGRPGGEPIYGPTVSVRRGHLMCLHPATPPLDAVGRRFRARIDEAVPIEFKAQAGDVDVNNNHRTLHARRAFTDAGREFARINTWMPTPVGTPSRFDRMSRWRHAPPSAFARTCATSKPGSLTSWGSPSRKPPRWRTHGPSRARLPMYAPGRWPACSRSTHPRRAHRRPAGNAVYACCAPACAANGRSAFARLTHAPGSSPKAGAAFAIPAETTDTARTRASDRGCSARARLR